MIFCWKTLNPNDLTATMLCASHYLPAYYFSALKHLVLFAIASWAVQYYLAPKFLVAFHYNVKDTISISLNYG
jgi:hypothetical protein